jgi:hypothetical protein
MSSPGSLYGLCDRTPLRSKFSFRRFTWNKTGANKMSNGTEFTEQQDAPTQQAITVGTAIPIATTIDAVFTAIYGTRSAALTPNTYIYSDVNQVQCAFSDGSMIVARFEARAFNPNKISA